MQATPKQLLIKIYDFAIVNCQKQNMAKTNEALQVLINSLRFDTEKVKEISTGLFRLYQFCQEEMRHKNYQIVYKILTELKESWIDAFNK
jgi:flagellar protein FliS